MRRHWRCSTSRRFCPPRWPRPWRRRRSCCRLRRPRRLTGHSTARWQLQRSRKTQTVAGSGSWTTALRWLSQQVSLHCNGRETEHTADAPTTAWKHRSEGALRCARYLTADARDPASVIAGSGKRMRSSEAPPQRSPAAVLDMLKSMEDPAVWAGFQVQRLSLYMPTELQSGTAGLSPLTAPCVYTQVVLPARPGPSKKDLPSCEVEGRLSRETVDSLPMAWPCLMPAGRAADAGAPLRGGGPARRRGGHVSGGLTSSAAATAAVKGASSHNWAWQRVCEHQRLQALRVSAGMHICSRQQQVRKSRE